MNSIKEAFNHSFEQVGYDSEPEFTIHGIGYQGKWGKDTMAMFIKDLESVEDGYKDQVNEAKSVAKDKFRDLENAADEIESAASSIKDSIKDLKNEQ